MERKDFGNRLMILKHIDVSIDRLTTLIEIAHESINSKEIVEHLGMTGPNATKINRAFQNIDRSQVLPLIEAWDAILGEKREKAKGVRVCVTGLRPKGLPYGVTDTFQTFLDLVTKATKEITIIGYHFTDGNNKLIKLLDERMVADRLRIKIITDHLLDRINDGNHRYITKWIKDVNYRCEIWSYEHPDPTKIMHIKCMLVDDTIAYIGSSNFSYHGAEKNIEMGITQSDRAVIEPIRMIVSEMISGELLHLKRLSYTRLKLDGII